MTKIGKITLTQEQAAAIEKYKADGHNLAVFVSHGKRGFHGELQSLRELTVDEMGRLLYEPNSYEVEKRFEVEDWVVNNVGTVGRIDRIFNGVAFGTWFNAESTRMAIPVESINRHATQEEIKAVKEKQFWKNLGREVGEFRKGDVYKYRNGLIFGVENRTETAKAAYMAGQLKGLYPIESFISFEEGDEV